MGLPPQLFYGHVDTDIATRNHSLDRAKNVHHGAVRWSYSFEKYQFAAVNYSLAERNWRIGQRIVEQEQNGASRAEYGKHVIEVASAALTKEFGKGFSETNIMNFKKFYLKFKELTIPQTVSEEFNNPIQQALPAELSPHFQKGQTLSDLFLSHFLYNYPFIY